MSCALTCGWAHALQTELSGTRSEIYRTSFENDLSGRRYRRHERVKTGTIDSGTRVVPRPANLQPHAPGGRQLEAPRGGGRRPSRAAFEEATLNEWAVSEGVTGEVRQTHDLGTRTLFIGEVIDAGGRDDDALVASMTDTL